MEKNFKRTLVTCALPYANGPVHIGHLAGVYVPADIYVRYLRMRGEDVLFICGSDEHGVPITIKARTQGVTPQDIVDKYHGIIKDSFLKLGINFDIYSRTTSKVHDKNASEFFRKLYDDDKFITKESEQYYDPEAKTFLADRYIIGTCPKCGNPGAYGDQCEKCGSTLSPEELIDPKSKLSGAQPVKKKTKHWYLPLDRYEPWLREWILEQHKEWRSNVYGQCKSWLDGGLQPRAVSRDLDWGVPVPVEGAEGKVLYVWFDAPIGYISNTLWRESENGSVRSVENLVGLYYTSVGRNSLLLLNVPPDTSGRIDPVDSARLAGFRAALDEIFSTDLAKGAKAAADVDRGRKFKAANMLDEDYDSCWAAPDGITKATLTFTLAGEKTFNRILLQEYIPLGQRVKAFSVEVLLPDGSWKEVASETTIGYKRIILTDRVTTTAVRIRIDESLACPVLNHFGLFLDGITG